MLDNENGLEGCVSVCRRISKELRAVKRNVRQWKRDGSRGKAIGSKGNGWDEMQSNGISGKCWREDRGREGCMGRRKT